MKRTLKGLLTICTVLAAAGIAYAAGIADYPAGVSASGIGGTRHNLGFKGQVLRVGTGYTTEICVFCHTPHHANTENGLRPLWNKGNIPSSYTAYGTTIAGTTAGPVGSTSLACLSCHDGITTFDNIVNAPGKGGVIAGGSNYNWSFRMPSPFVNDPLLDHFFTGDESCEDCHSGSIEGVNQVTRHIIGTDLSDDHPVSIPYNGTVAGLRPSDTVIGSIDLSSDLDSKASTAFGGNLMQNRWAVNGFISNTASISDILRDGKVECSSCHDPHFDNKSWDEAEPTWAPPGDSDQGWCSNDGETCSDGMFLRRVGGNTGSALCRTCHNK